MLVASEGPRARARPLAAERASVLMLMPAAVLIMIVLGALAVDRAIVFGAQRELVSTAQSAANDAAGLGVDIDRLRVNGRVEVDPEAIDDAVGLATASIDPGTSVTWELRGDVVVVRLERDVRLVFAPGIPGAAGTQHVVAVGTAELRRQ